MLIQFCHFRELRGHCDSQKRARGLRSRPALAVMVPQPLAWYMHQCSFALLTRSYSSLRIEINKLSITMTTITLNTIRSVKTMRTDLATGSFRLYSEPHWNSPRTSVERVNRRGNRSMVPVRVGQQRVLSEPHAKYTMSKTGNIPKRSFRPSRHCIDEHENALK